jgi:hypothetical protein
MPNHIINEIIFRDLTADRKNELLANCCDKDGKVDFEILVPMPLNVWRGSVGTRHEQAFKIVGLDWARENWGTKWNAYSHKPTETTADSLIFRFETAWRPPYGWLCAVFNRFKLSFEHNWLDEGTSRGVHGVFDWAEAEKDFGDPWKEEPADDALNKHLHVLHWGVESFEDESA